METGYECRDCASPAAVVVEGDRSLIVGTCGCDAPIVADMDAAVDAGSSLSA